MINIANSNATVNTELTSVIRAAIAQLGGDARLVNATSNKKHTQTWRAGKKGKTIPKSFTKERKVPFDAGEKVLFVRKEDNFYYYNNETEEWLMADSLKVNSYFDINDSIKSVKGILISYKGTNYTEEYIKEAIKSATVTISIDGKPKFISGADINIDSSSKDVKSLTKDGFYHLKKFGEEYFLNRYKNKLDMNSPYKVEFPTKESYLYFLEKLNKTSLVSGKFSGLGDVYFDEYEGAYPLSKSGAAFMSKLDKKDIESAGVKIPTKGIAKKVGSKFLGTCSILFNTEGYKIVNKTKAVRVRDSSKFSSRGSAFVYAILGDSEQDIKKSLNRLWDDNDSKSPIKSFSVSITDLSEVGMDSYVKDSSVFHNETKMRVSEILKFNLNKL